VICDSGPANLTAVTSLSLNVFILIHTVMSLHIVVLNYVGIPKPIPSLSSLPDSGGNSKGDSEADSEGSSR